MYLSGKISLFDEETGPFKPPVLVNITGIKGLHSSVGVPILISDELPQDVAFCGDFNLNNTLVCKQKDKIKAPCICKSSKLHINNCLNLNQSDADKFSTENVCIDFIQTSQISSSETNIPLNYPVNTTISVMNLASSGLASKHYQFIYCYLNDSKIPTFFVSDGKYLCELQSQVFGKQNISLYYENSDALNSKILISSSIEINFQSRF